MKTFLSDPVSRRWRSPLAALLAGVAAAALLVACGGGGGDASPAGGTATAQSFTAGPISGLGSIIVNGVRFDDSSARVEDDDGSLHEARALKLGMMVEVESSAIDDSTARATARVVRFGSEIVGPVAAVDATAQTVRVLDQTVAVQPTTVFDDSLVGGFAALTVGRVIEIHALFDASTGRYVATRVEDKTGALAFRLRGKVSALDTGAKTFRIGDAVIHYGGVAPADLPPLANDLRVRVRLQTTQNAAVQWVALSVRSGVRRVEDHADARLRGLVTAFTTPQQFEVQGIKVDATQARFEPNAAAVRLGAIVAVRGSASNGVILATRVDVKTGHEDDGQSVELHGALSALDTVAKTFMLREVKIDYSRVMMWKNGSVSDLATAKAGKLEVKGAWSADRSVLIAMVVEFED